MVEWVRVGSRPSVRFAKVVKDSTVAVSQDYVRFEDISRIHLVVILFFHVFIFSRVSQPSLLLSITAQRKV